MDPVDIVNLSETFDSAGEERKMLFLIIVISVSIEREFGKVEKT